MLSNARTNELLDLEVDLDSEKILQDEDEKDIKEIAFRILEIIRTVKGTRASLRKFYSERFLALPEIEQALPTDIEDDDAWLDRQDAPATISGGFMAYVMESFLESIREKFPGIYEKYTAETGKEELFEYIADMTRVLESGR